MVRYTGVMAINPTSPTEHTPSAEEEIRQLEQKLEEKKRALAENGEAPPEKEMLREVLKEHIEQERAQGPMSEIPSPTITPPITGQPQTPQQAKDDERRQQEIRALVEHALTKSIKDAVKIAQDESPYLLDELHDHLVDHYYDKLKHLRKIKKH